MSPRAAVEFRIGATAASRTPALRRQIEVSLAAQRRPKGGTLEVQPERVAVVIVEFVLDVDGSDFAAASVAHRAGPTMHLQLDRGFGRQASLVELATDY